MHLTDTVNRFYYRMALNELRVMNRGDYYRGLSYHSVLYLNVIAAERDCTAGKIAERLRVSKAAATLKLGELERQGFIVKRRSETDRRVQYIALTEETRQSLLLYDRVFARIEARLREEYGARDLALFDEILTRVSEFAWEDL